MIPAGTVTVTGKIRESTVRVIIIMITGIDSMITQFKIIRVVRVIRSVPRARHSGPSQWQSHWQAQAASHGGGPGPGPPGHSAHAGTVTAAGDAVTVSVRVRHGGSPA